MAKVDNPKDLIVLLLRARGHEGREAEPISGRTRLMKMVFLFDKEVRRRFNLDRAIPDSALPEFEPYDYGPFSKQVYADLDFLLAMGFAQVRERGSAPLSPEEVAAEVAEGWRAAGADPGRDGSRVEEVFSLSPIGRQFADTVLVNALSPEQRDVLDRFKARCTATPLRALLRYVYTKYPEYTTKSKIRDEVLR